MRQTWGDCWYFCCGSWWNSHCSQAERRGEDRVGMEGALSKGVRGPASGFLEQGLLEGSGIRGC